MGVGVIEYPSVVIQIWRYSDLDPLDGDADGFSLFVPAGGTPRPFRRGVGKSGSNRVQMDVAEFFFEFGCGFDFKAVVARLPDRIVGGDCCKIVWEKGGQGRADVTGRASLPFLNESG